MTIRYINNRTLCEVLRYIAQNFFRYFSGSAFSGHVVLHFSTQALLVDKQSSVQNFLLSLNDKVKF